MEEAIEDTQKEEEEGLGKNETEDEEGKGEAGWTGPTISPVIVPATPC